MLRASREVTRKYAPRAPCLSCLACLASRTASRKALAFATSNALETNSRRQRWYAVFAPWTGIGGQRARGCARIARMKYPQQCIARSFPWRLVLDRVEPFFGEPTDGFSGAQAPAVEGLSVASTRRSADSRNRTVKLRKCRFHIHPTNAA